MKNILAAIVNGLKNYHSLTNIVARMTTANMRIVRLIIRRMIPVKNGKARMNKQNLLAVIGSMQKNAMIGKGEKSPTLTEAMGMGGGQIPMIITKKG